MPSTSIFYQHLITEFPDFEKDMEQLGISNEQKEELREIVRKTIHLEVLHYIFSHLPSEQHALFLTQVETKPNDRGLLIFLKRSIENLEDNLKNVIQQVKQDFIHELREYKDASQEWLEGRDFQSRR